MALALFPASSPSPVVPSSVPHPNLRLVNLATSTVENIEHLRDNGFESRNTDPSEHVDIAEPVVFVFQLARPTSPIDYLRPLLRTLES